MKWKQFLTYLEQYEFSLLLVKDLNLLFCVFWIMRRASKSLRVSRVAIPYPIIAFFSDQGLQYLNSPCDLVKFAMNRQTLHHKLQRMKVTASLASSSVLSASQIGENQRIILTRQFAGDGQLKWLECEQQLSAADYKSYINPEIVTGRQPQVMQQESVSCPFLSADIWRYNQIHIKYQDEHEQSHEEHLRGRDARIFQHGYDYLYGRNLLDWRLHQGRLTVHAELRAKLPKTSEIISQYSCQLINILREYPHLAEYPSQVSLQPTTQRNTGRFPAIVKKQNFFQTLGLKDRISIEQDFMQRIIKHYHREMTLFMERLGMTDKNQQ